MKKEELAERIVIDYANLSGRETANRVEFRERVIKHLMEFEKEIIKLAEGMIKLKDTEPGGYNQALMELIQKLR